MGDAAEYVCFRGNMRVAEGVLSNVAVAAQAVLRRDTEARLLIFDRVTGKVIDLDLSGDVTARYAAPVVDVAKRGRPRLGVVPREVTLLPRHWDWLASQPGGASVTLRKLIEAARKAEGGDVRAKTAAAYAFMVAMAGDMAGFEEASRALFAGELAKLEGLMSAWPQDVRVEVLRFLAG
jgi:uncharacterized protein